MGDDGETFSSNINKPSPEQASEKQIIEEKKLIGEEEIDNAEQCEFVPNSDDSNVPCKESEVLALGAELESQVVALEKEASLEGRLEGAEDMHGAVAADVVAEAKVEAEVVVGGGERLVAEEVLVAESNVEFLEEKIGGENSDIHSGEKSVMDAEAHLQVLAEETPVWDVDAELEKVVGGGENVSAIIDHTLSGSAVVAAEEVEGMIEPVDFPEATAGDEEKNVSLAGDVREAKEVVEPGNLVVEEAAAGDDEKNASVVGAQSVAAVDEAKKVIQTGDIQVEEATVGDEGKDASILGVKSVAAVGEVEEVKEVVETGEFEVENTTVGDAGKDASNIAISSQLDSAESVAARSNDVVVDEAVAMVGGEKPPARPDNLQSSPNESVTVEQDAEMAVIPVESSAVVTGEEKEELPDGKEAMVDEIVKTEIKVDMEISTSAAEVTEGENIMGSHGLQLDDNEPPNSAKEEVDKEISISEETGIVGDAAMNDIKKMEDSKSGVAEEESLVANAEMDEKKQMAAPENSVPNDLEFVGQQSVVTVSIEQNKENIQEEGIPTADTEMEKKIEAEMEKEIEAEMVTTRVSDVESNAKIDDSVSVPQDEEDEDVVAEEGSALAETELETETDVGESSKAAGEKRKRGKNSKNLTNSKIGGRAQKLMDEDVCFICFDGGDLVLCDRRGCPKAYHPSCVNRDEAFFRAKGKWNCGWHICSTCQKNAYYMCLTCPFALCKGCVKDAVFLCVRGNKGFCETCMRIVKLIESDDKDTNNVQIDFDDKSSWEYLFKDYYTDLKSKLCISSAEIAKAKNPWKGSDVSAGKVGSPEAAVVTCNAGGSGTENSGENPEASKPKRKKGKKRLRSVANEEESAGAVVRGGGEDISSPGKTEWASEELLEFVVHMKNGDKSVLSQFDVQALLLEYIRRNKLRDPRKKSQIICDTRLENLFGKPRVGHFEMLKLLESHFLIKEDAYTEDNQGSVVDTEVNQLDVDENAETPTKGNKERKRKIRKKVDNRGTLANRYDYAAIDIHNINLIYLRRKLMEDLIEDIDEFQHKVIGTFVRIRISGNTQKQDLYRLVQVVGTSKAAEPYKVGKRTTDMMLEILNLNKTEIVSIDTISNQDFTEEECKRLRQSIKCGLLNRMTVGDILDKAMEIQAARVNDWLESETLRLSHLRDRASDMGRRKELRECVEKLQILKTPEERLRRLEEIPKIHSDPKMDPNHESEEDDSDTDDNRREVFQKTSNSGFTRRGRAPISPRSDYSPKDSHNGGNFSDKNREPNRTIFSKNLSIASEDASDNQSGSMVNEDLWNQGREKNREELNNLVNLSQHTKSDIAGFNSMASVNLSVSLPAKEAETVVKINETQKAWHYQDPSGKVQGPFSMAQLRKWSNTGYFPADLRIWRAIEKQDESILLTDALAGKLHKETSGDSKFVAASGKTSETSLLLSRENSFGERSNGDQHREAQTFHLDISKGLIAPPAEVPILSTEKWTRTNLSNLPSPTPKHSNTVETGEHGGTLIGGTSYAGGIQSPAAALPQLGNLPSVHGSVLNSREQLMNSLENDSVVSGIRFGQATNSEQNILGSVNSSQIPSLAATGEPRTLEEHGHHPAQTNGSHPIQSGNNQTPRIESHGWLGPPTQKVEPSNFVPMPGQSHGYGPWGVISPQAQNPTGNFATTGAPALPQPEFWGPPAQSNQPNMQTPAMPNLAWGTGLIENNSSASVLRSENSSTGWAPVQTNPNMGWTGVAPGTTNISWGATVQVPAPGSANHGWASASGNVGSSVQGQMPSNVISGWVAAPGNSGVQGMVLGGANPGWIAPGGNVGSAVQVPVPGNGWAMQTGNQGAPVQVAPSGNTSQGWGAPPGNQGTWGSSGQKDKGSQVGDSGFGDSRPKGPQVGDSGYGNRRPWNRQSSFGSRGRGPYNAPRGVLCPYNTNGKCRKGSHCNYIHEG
ncbi:zinc finger CCCH domain-containing protein 19 [Coffea eugenioides]|uniref:Zinc finger CCCH domain-containing protein 19-like n=1 Tax=Coffea arabica TaxID=13443 RepID=A0ABM4WUD4_COFAR|nr:zinc finger CCCH domain-containing protein 19 [Coffea eugenioides]